MVWDLASSEELMYPHRDRESIKGHYWRSPGAETQLWSGSSRVLSVSPQLQSSNVHFAYLYDPFIDLGRHPSWVKVSVKRSPFKVTVTPQMKLSNRSCGRWLAKDSTPLCGKTGNKAFRSNWTRFLCKVCFFVSCVMQGGWVSEGVICDFGWRGALRGWEGDHMWSSPPSKGHQSSPGVSRKAGENESVGKHILCFNDGASMSATFQFLDDR